MTTLLGFLTFALKSIGWDAEFLHTTRQIRVTDNYDRTWLVEARKL